MSAKIRVPEGMIAAIHAAMITPITNGNQMAYERAAAEAACRWLSENPIEPSEGQAAQMIGGNVPSGSSALCRRGAVEWQKRMFLAPDEPVKKPYRPLEQTVKANVMRSIMGCTFTRVEADEIIDAINISVAPVGNEDEPIRDLLLVSSGHRVRECTSVMDYDSNVREAYRRGREGK